ncbi:receptor-like protein 43 [Glycine max]|uniref:receptor-like protein 43 n=1 Tax=Glycine max TaxID=3847 RepID=UPI0007192F9B|nr:receptor-like protein 43 [Glycine max]|eukprot:XP_014624244.1 receptor-like protein 43 [Glycine max]
MESEFVDLAAAGKKAEWLRNLIYEIPLWPKPVPPMSIRCDSQATLAKAYSQVYNGKSRHLGVRHNMVRELIMHGVISVEFVRTQESVCIPSERETLLKFKNNLIDPSNRLWSWNHNHTNCCHWYGVLCHNLTSHLLQLHLSSSDYAFYDEEAYRRWSFGGEISPCLADLKHLNYLDLSGNYFLGEGMSIPSFLGTMTSLTHLDLSHSGFYGMIPPQIGNLSNLVYLDLRSVANGTVPSQIGNLSKLRYLDLTYNHLLGEGMAIPSFLCAMLD